MTLLLETNYTPIYRLLIVVRSWMEVLLDRCRHFIVDQGIFLRFLANRADNTQVINFLQALDAAYVTAFQEKKGSIFEAVKIRALEAVNPQEIAIQIFHIT